ncbi:GNAT family N-acetyltransferase [Cellulosimicrobium protaetiae]|uniref:GNAT family N-acetyltransferase n=1 Tax=Cellulosimicrobium protaetiae TaxID=2587808 RepID=A0A6M5UK05_9MICO|nr:GNAT family N-acetyltransferase [Cellulosimicrobium protaetiae]QJW37653.1 GNAT family N-acetyltransferase [Cellulosimicrobium protaetiae]
MSDSSLFPAPRPAAASPSGVLVRRAIVADRDDVWPLVLELPRHDPEREAFERSFGPLLAALDTYFAVAELPDHGVVGYLLANRHLTFGSNGVVCRVEEVAVLPTHRRQGIGRALLESAEGWAAEVGARRVGLATGLSKDFYVSGGYAETASFFTKHVEVTADEDAAPAD